jgi:hypothetical protein
LCGRQSPRGSSTKSPRALCYKNGPFVSSGLVGESNLQNGKVTLEVPPLVENGNAVPVTIIVDRQAAALLKLLLSLAGDEALFKGAIPPAAHDPHVTRTQPVA